MVASSPSPRSIMVTNPTQSVPRAVEGIVGTLLELVIHSIEGVREQLTKLTLRAAG
jgi:hypothetical protein